jgi:RNA-directed DNA polymerase
MLMEAIHKQDFYDYSYGFRPGRDAHQALEEIWKQCQNEPINWIVDADVSGFFDELKHDELREFITRRVNDGTIRRLIEGDLQRTAKTHVKRLEMRETAYCS